jgi:hypothetical protein
MSSFKREQLLNALAAMVTEDFGEPNEDGSWDPLCGHCLIHHAVATILALYEHLEADEGDDDGAEAIADRVTGTKLH